MIDFIIEYIEVWESGHAVMIDGVEYVPVVELAEVLFKACCETVIVSQVSALIGLASIAASIAGAWLIARAVRLWVKPKEENK